MEETMPVCYFNEDYENKYRCEYSINDDDFTVEVEYDIQDEIPDVDGVKCFTTNTKYDNRDILILDYDNKKNYLLKNYQFHTVSVLQSFISPPEMRILPQLFFQEHY